MPISEEKQKVISKAIEDCGLSPDLFETFKKIAEDDDGFGNDALYRCIVQAGKTIKVLKETFNETILLSLAKLCPCFVNSRPTMTPARARLNPIVCSSFHRTIVPFRSRRPQQATNHARQQGTRAGEVTKAGLRNGFR
ncbi:hypothetical protein VE01_07674 [Pseudogymnoascus verrucosus]|uniref:Uncharacterized protein n=1 Tax=Pseudogymnoascus verrucosus TaxID=342668 RepID=A0A1B8GEX0_9PEZI|nr:uncharacterized protein VE01_07674 [Pseudogymnoascus verrucosus]OBT94367.1 hypothetical protein VE01_07674 [Pseudogymnoascus verrucosus]